MSERMKHQPRWRMRVLVVEDNPKAADGLAGLLRDAGHEIEVAADGPAAVSAAENHHPDVVLLDIGLPGLCGWEVAKALHALPADKRPLLVAVTGYGDDEDHRRSREVGIDLHLTKPVDPDRLQRLLRRFRSFVAPAEDGPT
jgi:CheY-like chemotaxis protein